jgi:hypothetical protein
VANGQPLSIKQTDLRQSGHSLECRIYAEVPEENFRPDTGSIAVYRPPTGPGIRLESGIEQNSVVVFHYDPMLAKLNVGLPLETRRSEQRCVGLCCSAFTKQHRVHFTASCRTRISGAAKSTRTFWSIALSSANPATGCQTRHILVFFESRGQRAASGTGRTFDTSGNQGRGGTHDCASSFFKICSFASGANGKHPL